MHIKRQDYIARTALILRFISNRKKDVLSKDFSVCVDNKDRKLLSPDVNNC